MKTHAYICLLGLLASVSSCQDDALRFPTQMAEQLTEKGMPIAGPANAILTGTYDLKFRVQWEGVSDRVEKAIISYTEADGDRTIEVTDFSQDYFIQAEEFREYAFGLRYQAKDGTLSNVIKRTAMNKQNIVDYLRDNFELSKTFNSLRIVWENESNSPINVEVLYESGGQTYSMATENSTRLRDTLLTVRLPEGKVDFTVKFSDANGRTSEKNTSFTLVRTSYATADDKAGWTITASSQNSNNHRPQNLISGTPGTDVHWHTPWSGNPGYPHEVELTLDMLVSLDQLTFHNRTNGNNDGVRTFDIYAKEKDEDGYELIAQDLEQIRERGQNRTFDLTPTKPIKMIKFVFKDGWPLGWGGNNPQPKGWAHLGEIDIKGFPE